jgi:hypothetical protein
MSKAYWIVRVSVRDEQRYPEYLAAAGAAFRKFGANFIVRGGKFETRPRTKCRGRVQGPRDGHGLLSEPGISGREGHSPEVCGRGFYHH